MSFEKGGIAKIKKADVCKTTINNTGWARSLSWTKRKWREGGKKLINDENSGCSMDHGETKESL